MSPTRRGLLRSLVGAGVLAVLPETAYSKPTGIDADDVPFLWHDDDPSSLTTWREIDQPAYETFLNAEELTFVMFMKTKQGHSGNAVLTIRDDELREQASDEIRPGLMERRRPDLHDLPKWFWRQIGDEARDVDAWASLRADMRLHYRQNPGWSKREALTSALDELSAVLEDREFRR